MSERECGIPNCGCGGREPSSPGYGDKESRDLTKKIAGLWEGLGLKKDSFQLRDYIIAERPEPYTGDRDPFKVYADKPMNWDRNHGRKLVGIEAWGDDEKTSAIDLVPGAQGPYCPPNDPKTLAEADTRVEWVLNNLCTGELHRLYKLLHDGIGVRVESCDEAVKRWKKGLTS